MTKLTWKLKPRARKIWLLLHVAISVGWFGGAYAMLVMGIAAMTHAGQPLRPAAYELMHLSDTMIMIPGSLGALVTGVVLALYTQYRLLHFWWVLVKLVLTIGAMVYAYLYVATTVRAAIAGTQNVENDVIVGSVAMLVILFATTLLSVVKPWGRTPLGQRAIANRRTRA